VEVLERLGDLDARPEDGGGTVLGQAWPLNGKAFERYQDPENAMRISQYELAFRLTDVHGHVVKQILARGFPLYAER